MLGRYLARNLAGEHDPVQARRYLELAQAAGVADAAPDLARLDASAQQGQPATVP